MKLILLNALKEWLLQKTTKGAALWPEIAEAGGFSEERFITRDNYAPKERMDKLLDAIMAKLAIDSREFRSQFLEFWLTSFAPRIYQSLAKQATNARDCLIQIIRLQNELCTLFPSNPLIGKVDMNDINENTLTVIYASEKTLIDIIAILRGVSGLYGETFNVKKINPHSAEIKFEKH